MGEATQMTKWSSTWKSFSKKRRKPRTSLGSVAHFQWNINPPIRQEDCLQSIWLEFVNCNWFSHARTSFQAQNMLPSSVGKWSRVYSNNCRDELGVRWRGRAAPAFSRLELFFLLIILRRNELRGLGTVFHLTICSVFEDIVHDS